MRISVREPAIATESVPAIEVMPLIYYGGTRFKSAEKVDTYSWASVIAATSENPSTVGAV